MLPMFVLSIERWMLIAVVEEDITLDQESGQGTALYLPDEEHASYLPCLPQHDIVLRTCSAHPFADLQHGIVMRRCYAHISGFATRNRVKKHASVYEPAITFTYVISCDTLSCCEHATHIR